MEDDSKASIVSSHQYIWQGVVPGDISHPAIHSQRTPVGFEKIIHIFSGILSNLFDVTAL